MKKRAQQRWFLNLGLLVIIIALLFIAYVGQSPEEEKPKRVSDYLPTGINQIAISRPGKKTISFQQKDHKWQMQEPYTMRADENMVGRLLAISNLQISNILNSDKIQAENIGLAQPFATITFNDTAIAFGDPQPVGQQRYIRLGQQIMLVDDQHVNELNTGSIAYIDRQLIPLGDKISRLVINEQELDISKATGVADQWSSIKASWMSHAAEMPSTGLNVDITLQDSSTIHYLVQRRENDVVLINKDYPFEYHLPVHALGTLAITFPADETDDSDSGQ
jgi:hypothetical protein